MFSHCACCYRESRRLCEIGLTERDLHRAKLNYGRKLTTRFADTEQTFHLISDLAIWGEVPQNILGNILAVSTAEVNETLARCTPADRFVFTATGPIFEEGIEQFDLGN